MPQQERWAIGGAEAKLNQKTQIQLYRAGSAVKTYAVTAPVARKIKFPCAPDAFDYKDPIIKWSPDGTHHSCFLELKDGILESFKTGKDQRSWYGQSILNKIEAFLKGLFGKKQ